MNFDYGHTIQPNQHSLKIQSMVNMQPRNNELGIVLQLWKNTNKGFQKSDSLDQMFI